MSARLQENESQTQTGGFWVEGLGVWGGLVVCGFRFSGGLGYRSRLWGIYGLGFRGIWGIGV